MLSDLLIINFALIERLELSFGTGFNVLTGETGAGKSIIVGAVNLILGSRASTDLIREGCEETEVQAAFIPPESGAFNQSLIELGLPRDDNLVIRRIISRTNRNRIFINGSPASLTQLTRLGEELVSISGQHEHQRLLDREWQLLLLDQYGNLMADRAVMEKESRAFSDLRNKISSMEKKISRAREDIELHESQVREIREANPRPGEDTALEQERGLIRNAEKIYNSLQQSYEKLYGQTGAVTEILDDVRGDLARMAELDNRLSEQAGQLENAYHQITDAAQALNEYLDRLTFSPERQEEVEDRLALITRLKRKYGPELTMVMEFSRRVEAELDSLAALERDLEVKKNETDLAEKKFRGLADRLTKDRRSAAAKMSRAVKKELRTLGMPKLEFDISFSERPDSRIPGPTGWDEIEFLISPNLGEDLKPLAQIASGGELSRTLLGLNAILAGQDKTHSLIFDEVDSGIGGGIAEVIGRKINTLSKFHQILCVTHLPQIAAFAQNHHLVFKEVRRKLPGCLAG
ncbi:MAG: DNA repair protein RecN [Deltaproteobacteria bacterium]|nr:DNA repair protein RecN [Deltaproteobacteria bacterium]